MDLEDSTIARVVAVEGDKFIAREEEEEEEEEGENARGKMDATWDDARRPIRFVREGGRERRRDPADDRSANRRRGREKKSDDRARSIGRTLPNGNARIVSVSDSGPTPPEIAATSRGLSSTSPTVTLIVRARE